MIVIQEEAYTVISNTDADTDKLIIVNEPSVVLSDKSKDTVISQKDITYIKEVTPTI